jgi:hypothetical protein
MDLAWLYLIKNCPLRETGFGWNASLQREPLNAACSNELALAAAVAAALALPHAALAEIKVGATVAATGTAAALGELFPEEIAGEKVTVILLGG